MNWYLNGSYKLIEFISRIELFENRNRFPLKPVLGGVAGVANFRTGHEQTLFNKTELAIFIFYADLAYKGSNYSELIILFHAL